MDKIKALDTFAGTGWGVACKWLGIEEDGVEIMPEAVATREANGMTTIYRDVWEGILLSKEEHEAKYGTYDLKISSPPCQTFSVAGGGAGRRALDEVIQAIQLHAYKDPAELRAFGEKYDMRTALVLTPLAYIWRDMPRLVALEQVPTVLPVWEAYAEIMADLGYSVKTAILNAEQYGVPQTRRRAILVARLDGEVQLPKPTHSRYYSRTPGKFDPGVKKWVSMAEALGWGMTRRPYPTIATGTEKGGTDPAALGGSGARRGVYAERSTPGAWEASGDADNDGGILRLTAEEASVIQTYPVFTQNNRLNNQARRPLDHPAPTITAGHDSGNRGFIDPEGKFVKATVEEVSALQSYPVFRNGNQANSAKRELSQPAPTIHFSARANKVEWIQPELAFDPAASGERVTVDEASALQTFPNGWGFTNRPAVTVGNAVGRGLIGGSGAKDAVVRAIEDGSFIPSPNGDGSNYAEQTRITTAEAGVLQTYDRPFVWAGSKTKQFLQIGNAVPPILAQAVLSALIADNEEGTAV